MSFIKHADDWKPLGAMAACALFIAALVAIPIGIWWYKASLQAGVYKRQGIEMSTWECMWGAQPAERVIQVKP